MGVLKQTTVDSDSAESLAMRISAGDQDAEGALYERYSSGILFLLRQRCVDPMQAEDLMHEAFRIVIERLRHQNLENPERLSAYVHKVAVNLAIGENRKVVRRNTYIDSDTISGIADIQPDIIEQINREDLSKLVHRLLLEMTVPRDRDVLRLYFIHEMDKAAICRRLNLSPAHFDRVFYRAKQRFRTILEASGEELP